MKPFDSASFRSAPSRGVLCSLLALAGTSVRGDVVATWNRALAQYVSATDVTLAPHLEARVYAMTHLAILDAIEEATHASRRAADGAAASRAATASAAAAMVAELVPQASARAQALAAEQLAAVPEGPEKTRGLTSGRAAAARIVRERAGDGWVELALMHPPYGPPPDQSETLARAIVEGAHPPRSPWDAAKPFLLKKARQFEVAVPSFTAVDGSVRVNHGLLQSKLFNAVDRTVAAGVLQQTWDERPVFRWNRIARTVVEGKGLPLREEARMFALLNLAVADATLSVLHWRFTLGSWGCQFVEVWADGRGVPMSPSATTAPAVFDSFERGTAFLETRRVLIPPMANYPSPAATLAGAAQAALAGALKTDRVGFTLELTGHDGAPLHRTFGSMAEAARECAFVATLDGRHTREAGIAGHELGAAIGREAVKRFARAHR